jgi:hypothetical protein
MNRYFYLLRKTLLRYSGYWKLLFFLVGLFVSTLTIYGLWISLDAAVLLRLAQSFTDFIPAIVAGLAALFGLSAAFTSFIKSDTVTSSSIKPSSIERRLRDLESAVRSTSDPALLSPEKHNELFAAIMKRVEGDLTTDVIKAEIAKIQEAQKEAAKRDQFLVWSEQATQRITQQIEALGGRANLNLFIGLILALSGIGFLIYYVQTTLANEKEEFAGFAIHFLPRLSLVTIIELFSYFFLHLYKQAIDEIKYFQNEITNIDMKMIAASITQQLSPTNPTAVIAALSGTERNFLIPKDQKIVAEAAAFNMQTGSEKFIELFKEMISKQEKKP